MASIIKALEAIQEILSNIQTGRSDHNYPLIAELDDAIKQIKQEMNNGEA